MDNPGSVGSRCPFLFGSSWAFLEVGGDMRIIKSAIPVGVSGKGLACFFLAFLFMAVVAAPAMGAVSAGYSEFYIPGDEDNMMRALEGIGQGTQNNGTGNHAVISVVAGSDSTVIYYDHWEDGYDFDKTAPATADETYTLVNKGDTRAFTSANIPVLPRGTATFYDGRDRIYVAGGAATVTRSGWTEQAGTLLAVAWEVYPVRPQLTTYITPFGEDLFAANLLDFERVYTLIQATADGTTVQIDIDADGTYDNLDTDRDGTGDGTTVSLNRGDVFMLDRVTGMTNPLPTGVHIEGSDTLQVQYIIGDEKSGYEVRGLSAFPRGFWDDDYYAPVDGAAAAHNDQTDIFLHNPHDTAITITYESTSRSRVNVWSAMPLLSTSTKTTVLSRAGAMKRPELSAWVPVCVGKAPGAQPM